jgi:two-component sensor histidine kinase
MADYYLLIARAVAGLNENTGEARRALYGRARAALEAQRQGFGSRIITQMIGQLDGKARFDWRTEGLICEITFGGEGGLHAHQ